MQGYVTASLALFSDHAMRNLVCRRFGPDLSWRMWPSWLYARGLSRFMVLKLPGETLMLGRPLPHPRTARPTDFLLTHHGRRVTVYQLRDVMNPRLKR